MIYTFLKVGIFFKVREYNKNMLKWKWFDESLLNERRWVLMLWLLFIMFALAYIALTPRGELNILLSQNYFKELGSFFKYFTRFGEEWLLIPIGLIFIFVIKSIDFTIRLTATFILNTLITVPVKFYLFDYNRPKIDLHQFNLIFTEGVTVHDYHSFPSGHSSAAFAMALAIAFWYNHKAISIVVILMAIGVGFSRIYLQQHFVEDVIGGAVIGLIAAWLASGFYWLPKKND